MSPELLTDAHASLAPGWIAKGAIVLAIVPLALFGVRFHAKQKEGALGGRISRAKAYWLPFAIWFWFVVCPAVGFDGVVHEGARNALVAFGVFMWLRGAAEMVMLYVTKNWRPPMGITHDALCALLVLGLATRGLVDVAAVGFDTLRALDLWAYGLCAVVLVSLAVEIHHAHSFFVAARGMTTGDDGIWFADDEEERFREINRNTLVWNVILTIAVSSFVIRYLLA